jgi:hypothetical protein
MPPQKPPLKGRLLVIAGLTICGAAALVLLARYGLHRLAVRTRGRR